MPPIFKDIVNNIGISVGKTIANGSHNWQYTNTLLLMQLKSKVYDRQDLLGKLPQSYHKVGDGTPIPLGPNTPSSPTPAQPLEFPSNASSFPKYAPLGAYP